MSNSEWKVYIEPGRKVRIYYCKNCRIFHGLMHNRTVTDREGNVHKEYKIVCEKCSSAGPLHWSKNLAEHSWKGMNPNFDNDYVSKDLDEFLKER